MGDTMERRHAGQNANTPWLRQVSCAYSRRHGIKWSIASLSPWFCPRPSLG